MRSSSGKGFRGPGGPILVSVLLLGSLGAPAQDQDLPAAEPAPEELASVVARGLAGELALSEEQLPLVQEALVPEMQRKIEILLGTEDLDPSTIEGVRREFHEAQTATRDRLKYVLDPDQLAGLEQAQERQRPQLVAELVVLRLTPPLALTEEQQQQLLPIFVDNMEARRDLMQELGNRRGRRGTWEVDQRTRALEDELQRQLEPLLSAAQLSRFSELAAEFRDQRKTGARTRGRR